MLYKIKKQYFYINKNKAINFNIKFKIDILLNLK